MNQTIRTGNCNLTTMMAMRFVVSANHFIQIMAKLPIVAACAANKPEWTDMKKVKKFKLYAGGSRY